ncbi:hypothetical protein [Rheinheimera texasensis]|uniref:hypothetical protein n=1 Tax=Rheinheimera texasensis TaxID=306205 RepID=UPI0032B18A49
MHQSHAEECSYRISENPQVADNRVEVFLGLNTNPVKIKDIDKVSSITVQRTPFRIVLFDEPSDYITITTTESESHKLLFPKLLEIKDACSKESLVILNEFIGGVKGDVFLHISKDTSSFHFWGKDRYSESNSLTSFYKVQGDIFVVSRTTKIKI